MFFYFDFVLQQWDRVHLHVECLCVCPTNTDWSGFHLLRVFLAGMKISRPAQHIGRYKMIKHQSDLGNTPNPKR